jgi:hypothetical protein
VEASKEACKIEKYSWKVKSIKHSKLGLDVLPPRSEPKHSLTQPLLIRKRSNSPASARLQNVDTQLITNGYSELCTRIVFLHVTFILPEVKIVQF